MEYHRLIIGHRPCPVQQPRPSAQGGRRQWRAQDALWIQEGAIPLLQEWIETPVKHRTPVQPLVRTRGHGARRLHGDSDSQRCETLLVLARDDTQHDPACRSNVGTGALVRGRRRRLVFSREIT